MFAFSLVSTTFESAVPRIFPTEFSTMSPMLDARADQMIE